MPAYRRSAAGIPIEEAPVWVLVLFAGLLWLVVFPALVGLLDAAGRWHGQRSGTAVAALVVTVVLVVGLASRKPWKRPSPGSLEDHRPLFVRFSTWLVTALFLPNVIQGVLVMARDRPTDYLGSLLLGLLLSAVHALLAWRQRRSDGRPPEGPAEPPTP